MIDKSSPFDHGLHHRKLIYFPYHLFVNITMTNDNDYAFLLQVEHAWELLQGRIQNF